VIDNYYKNLVSSATKSRVTSKNPSNTTVTYTMSFKSNSRTLNVQVGNGSFKNLESKQLLPPKKKLVLLSKGGENGLQSPKNAAE
jgi:hypothetical protein